ncbi:Cyclin-D4-1 like [Actinidia chinensis var. chinensis]|uniref:Cyclin-D4-1 like n=1 Tax=Actinidia chinensis var. chinensis TaxID=1590841 RepID=A0A2R6RGY1_ACTCC|nr:Cyclin-D4-1 like [Actinidia chinensis var. chinensis]
MSHSPDHSAASLCCSEGAVDAVSSDPQPYSLSSPPDEAAINRYFDSEPLHMPHSHYLRSIDLTARQDSISWILKVHSHYQFRPLTAFLSVNYFDRFLSSHSFPQANGWPFQLLAVACLSVAAKMEEPFVPLLLDLQVLEPRFVFEPKTVQRMELWVMANLDWRLRSVTPFDYIDYFVSRLPCSGSESGILSPLYSSSSDLILNTIRVIDFLGFPPSAIAAAAVLSAAGESIDLPETFYGRTNKEMVRSCHQLMEVYLVDTCPSAGLKDSMEAPPSPDGVLDAAACVSCDTRSENRISGSESTQADPENKRPRSSTSDVQEQQP